MDVRRVGLFLRKHRKDAVLSLIALLMTGAIAAVLFYVAGMYQNISAAGGSVVSSVVVGETESTQTGEMSYRELSEAYASLEATCQAWTELTQEQSQAGIKGGLYFISRENLEFCIYHANSSAFCEEDYTLSNFDHIWMNSEHDNFYVVVNLSGKEIDFTDYYILARDDSTMYASRVLINCYEAEQVNLSDCVLTGTLLAPNAVVTCDDTYVYGQILARKVTGSRLADKEVAFTGYQSIMDGLRVVTFQNDGVRRAALEFLKANDTAGRYSEYTEDSQILKRDLQEVTQLVIEDCTLVSLEQDLAKFQNLISLQLHNTNLTALSLVGQGELLDLEITDTPLETLDLTDVPLLKRLVLDRTSLTQLSLSAVPGLSVLSYSGTPLGWMDYAPLSKLRYLDCSDSGVTQGKITGETLPALVTLRIEKNKAVTEIDVSSFAELARLDCASCSLTRIALEDFTKLRYLRCSYNRITELDFSNFTQVYSVECYGTSLKSMTVTNWAEAVYADCEITRLHT